jgi:hypothetical protein
MNLLSRLGIILVRILIFYPALISNFWYLYAIQGIWGILCLMPYPDFLFRKKIKKFFLLLIFICVANVLWRIWVPSYYTSSQLKNYPEAVKNFDEAKQKPRSFGYSFEEENGTTLWWIQMPDYYEWQLLIVQTLASLGPFALFFIRDYQVRHGFTWKEAINKITSR